MNRFEQVHVAGEEVPNVLVVEGGGLILWGWGGPHKVSVGNVPQASSRLSFNLRLSC